MIRLGKDYAGRSESETRSRMSTVIALAGEAAAGKKVEWKGRQRDPRYRLTNKKIIEEVGITPSEEAEMKTIISADTKRRRDAARKREKRRAEGAVPREERTAKTRESQRIAKDLSRQGMSLREIGKKLEVSHTHVRRLINEETN